MPGTSETVRCTVVFPAKSTTQAVRIAPRKTRFGNQASRQTCSNVHSFPDLYLTHFVVGNDCGSISGPYSRLAIYFIT